MTRIALHATAGRTTHRRDTMPLASRYREIGIDAVRAALLHVRREQVVVPLLMVEATD